MTCVACSCMVRMSCCVLWMWCLLSVRHAIGSVAVLVDAHVSPYVLMCDVVCVQVPLEDVGTSIGLSHATRSLCGIVSPVVGGYLVNAYGFRIACGVIPAVFNVAALAVLTYISQGPVDKPGDKQA